MRNSKRSPELIDALSGHHWDDDMVSAPCQHPCLCFYGSFCPCCATFQQREKILDMTGEPYVFLDGACCCCKDPVDENCKTCCLCFEVCCCLGAAQGVNRFMVQTRFVRENDACDDCISDCVTCVVIGCMYAQQEHELNVIEEQGG